MEAQVLPGSTAIAFILAARPLALLPTTVVFYGRQAAECNARQLATNCKLFQRVFERLKCASCLAHERRGEHNDEQPKLRFHI